MTLRNQAILAFAVGYFGAALLPIVAAYLVLMPFGYGYIGAELMVGYFVWATAYRWELVNEQLATMLDVYDL